MSGVKDLTNLCSSFFSVFPNVPQAPGLSCDGEDRKCFEFILIIKLKNK